jgi:hypothetical protein
MMNHFRVFDRETGFLLPPSVEDWSGRDVAARKMCRLHGRARRVQFYAGVAALLNGAPGSPPPAENRAVIC